MQVKRTGLASAEIFTCFKKRKILRVNIGLNYMFKWIMFCSVHPDLVQNCVLNPGREITLLTEPVKPTVFRLLAQTLILIFASNPNLIAIDFCCLCKHGINLMKYL